MIRKTIVLLAIVMTPAVSNATSFKADQTLSFGTLTPLLSRGIISVGLNNDMTTNGNVAAVPSGAGHSSGKAVFKATGLGGIIETVSIYILNSPVTLSNSSGGNVIVDNFVVTPALVVGVVKGSVDVYFGGTLSFSESSTPGYYTGQLQVRGSSPRAGSASVSIPIALNFFRNLNISQTAGMNFGAIESRTGNAVIRLATGGGRTIASGAAGVSLITASPGAAGGFKVTGNPGAVITVSLPVSTTLTGPGAAMTVNNFTVAPSTLSTVLDASGNLTLRIGADLKVNTGQVGGTYNGTYTVTVSY